METITLNGIEHVQASSKPPSDIQILVLQRGWVVVGDVSKDGEEFTIRNASVIRQWGTARGLGEIATGGPTSKTVLDPCPDIRCHELTVVLRMDCEASEWH